MSGRTTASSSVSGEKNFAQQNGNSQTRTNVSETARFTMDGDDALETHLAATCEKIRAAVESLVAPSQIEALVLGGGYGRGQGGVLKTDSGDLPYNDLEFYVFTRGNRLLDERRYRKDLEKLGERLSPEAGLHVEFKVDSPPRLRRSPVTMFSYDLVSGHRVLVGSENVFSDCDAHRNAEKIPIHAATRLLFNRCTGLLLAKEMLLNEKLSAEQCDFIGRNLAKARLALGDVVLTAFQKYHWNCIERRERLGAIAKSESLPWLTEVQRCHTDGVEFKLHPQRVLKSAEKFRLEHAEISNLARQVWLWLEARRLNQPFPSAREYALAALQKCPGNFAARNILLNVRTFGARGAFEQLALRYPRERLLNALPLLLWEEPIRDLRLKRHLQKQLRTPDADWQSWVAAYKRIWPRFN
jgi:hypothetical protein